LHKIGCERVADLSELRHLTKSGELDDTFLSEYQRREEVRCNVETFLKLVQTSLEDANTERRMQLAQENQDIIDDLTRRVKETSLNDGNELKRKKKDDQIVCEEPERTNEDIVADFRLDFSGSPLFSPQHSLEDLLVMTYLTTF
jgi:hypothetical protein